jgi:hypothetical protein
MKIYNFSFKFWLGNKPLTTIKYFVDSRWFTKIRFVYIWHWLVATKQCTRMFHSLVNEWDRHLQLSNYSFYIYLILNFNSYLNLLYHGCHYPQHPCEHSRYPCVTLILPHSHHISGHELVAALRLGSGLFPQGGLIYHFWEYLLDTYYYSDQHWRLI